MLTMNQDPSLAPILMNELTNRLQVGDEGFCLFIMERDQMVCNGRVLFLRFSFLPDRDNSSDPIALKAFNIHRTTTITQDKASQVLTLIQYQVVGFIGNHFLHRPAQRSMLFINYVQFKSQYKNIRIIIEVLMTETTNQANEQSQYNNIPGAGLSIVFIFGGLLYGGLLKSICSRFGIPFNPLLLVSGILLGNYHESFGFMGVAAKLVSELNPNGFLAIFLPPLLFESAFKTEWHLFKKQFEQTLILGIPCVLLASLLIMASVKLILNYDDQSYTWLEAFLLGCILCCTDIFSFVSKLQQIGTPKRLVSLIEGESLFNYFTCFLIFQIINEIIINFDNYSVLSIGQLVVQEILGGFLFGLCFGMVGLFFMKRINYDGILVVTVLVIFCYTNYMIAQFSVLRISGIISIVTYGIFMGIFGKPHLVGESAQCLEDFWSYVVFIAETNIFLIAGVLVGVNVLFLQGLMNSDEFWNIFYIFLLVLASRFISILIFKKQLVKLGYGMQLKEAFVIALSGLKGAIGISFAMIVFENEDYSTRMRNLFLMHVTGNSLLNLFINSLGTVFAVKYLGISTITKIECKFFKEFLQRMMKMMQNKKAEMRQERYLDNVVWEEVQKKIGMETYQQMIHDLSRDQNLPIVGGKLEERGLLKLQQALQDFANKNNPTNDMAKKQFEEENIRFHTIVEVRKRFINALRHKYSTYHYNYNTSPPAVMVLMQSASFDLDTKTQELESWSWIKNQFSSTIKKISIIGSFARNYLFNYISYCYDVVSSYIQANEQVRMEFRETMGDSFDEEILEMILNESEENQKEAEDFLNNYLQPSFPEIEQEVKTRKASFNLLLSFKHIIDRYDETGQLQSGQYDLLTDLITQKRLSLDLHNPKWTTISFKQILTTDQIFGLLPDKILSVLDQNLSTFQTFDSNQIIQTQASIAKYIYFIRRGGCLAEFSHGNFVYKESLLVGNLFGFQSLVSQTYQSTVTTNTLVVAVGVKKVCIQKIMDYFPQFEECFWRKYLFILYKMFATHKDISFHLSHLKKPEFDEIVGEFKFVRLDEGVHKLNENYIFLRGRIESMIEDDSLEKVQPLTIFLKSEYPKIKVLEKSSFLSGQISLELIQQTRYMQNLNANSKKKSSRPSYEVLIPTTKQFQK